MGLVTLCMNEGTEPAELHNPRFDSISYVASSYPSKPCRIPGNSLLSKQVHIADVTQFVKPDTDLDREARAVGV